MRWPITKNVLVCTIIYIVFFAYSSVNLHHQQANSIGNKKRKMEPPPAPSVGTSSEPSTARKSRRLSHEPPDALPPPSSTKRKSQVAQLLARDTHGGRIRYETDRMKEWFPPAPAGGKSSDDISSLTGCTTPSTKMKKKKPPPPPTKTSADGSSVPSVDANDAGMKLLPFNQLKSLIEGSCCCKICQRPVLLKQETLGVATNLFLECVPENKRKKPHFYSLTAEKLPTPPPPPPGEKVDKRKLPRERAAKKYLLNSLLWLAAQQLGLGVESIQTFLGMLGMKSSVGSKQAWKDIQEIVGAAEEKVMEEILAENIERARAKALEVHGAAACMKGGRVGVDGSIDMGWSKRSAGRSYDSPSGHSFLVDCRTGLILAVEIYSKHCSKCDKGKDEAAIEDDEPAAQVLAPAEGHRCPKNFVGASKAMESIAAAEIVTRVWNGGRVWVKTIVGDDDSTTRAVLSLNLKEYQEAHPDVDRASYWPTFIDKSDGKTKFKKNKGRLHWSVSPPEKMLADPTHRVRVIAKALFAYASNETRKHVTNADALRLKRNLGYAHKQNKHKPYDEYVKAMWAALYHHFNDHSKCSKDWCPWKPAGDRDPAENTKGVKRSSDNNKWKNCLEVFETYLTDHYLQQTYHNFDSQKNESLNLKVATVAPKHKCFSKTKSLHDRIALVVAIDSVGADAAITRIVDKICGPAERKPLPPLTHAFLFKCDQEAKRKRVYNAKTETKARRAKKAQRQIKKKILEDQNAKRKGLYYYPGVAVAPVPAKKTKKRKKKAADSDTVAGKNTGAAEPRVCKWCGLAGHVRRTHKDCLQRIVRPPNAKKPSNKNSSEENQKTSDVTSAANEEEPLSLLV
jgi:hypothetical protein